MKVKKGDEVVVIAGKDRGVKGKVIAADPATNKVVVEGVNRVTKHTRVTATQRGAKAGGIEHIEAPINASNVMVDRQRGQGDPRRLPARRGERPQRARVAPLREGPVSDRSDTETPVPRLKTPLPRGDRARRCSEQFSFGNPMQIPGLVKIVVNMGVGQAAKDSKLMDGAVRDLTLITGQKPLVQRARKSIAQFKLREGMPIGAKVTLRGDRMWEFLDRLLSLALPRIRDFRGLSDQQFDGNGNYTFGLTEQSMFHEIDPDSIDRPRGMDITVVTTATTDDEGRALLRALGFPFRLKENS